MTQPALPALDRPAFFDGQRLTAADLAASQVYARELRWLHNRALHGWGIAFGYGVSGESGERKVRVDPGYALDRLGRDLVLERRVELAVPPDAGPTTYYLTVTYTDDAHLEAERRAGACGVSGAVRLLDEPTIAWRESKGLDPELLYHPGIDVLLATANVADCRLQGDVDLGGRRELRRPGPYVFAGETDPSDTRWRLWPDETNPLGLATTVPTAHAGFSSTPRYQARVAGERAISLPVSWSALPTIVDGYAHVGAASATSFELQVLLPISRQEDWLNTSDGYSGTGNAGGLLNPDEALTTDLPARVRSEGWHVVWMGVEE